MLIATYNIQWGMGRDGNVDLRRIALTIESADVIAFQEVERFWRDMPHADQPARLSELLPDRYTAFAPSVDIDASQVELSGKVLNRRRQYGLYVLSRWPILSVRSLPLPKSPVVGEVVDQAILMECVIRHPATPFRLYVTHLSYLSARQRLMQIDAALHFIARAPLEGGVLVGDGAPDDRLGADWLRVARSDLPPMPRPAIFLGDFNMRPSSREYERIVGPKDPDYGRLIEAGLFADALALSGLADEDGVTFPANGEEDACRIDHVFVTPDLARKLKHAWIDETADASDHQPVFAKFDL